MGTAQRANEKSPEATSKSWKTELHDRELKTAVTKKLKEIQEYSERQHNELRNDINKQKQSFTPKRLKL